MKKQRTKLDRDRFCNNVIPSKDEHNRFLYALNSRSHRRKMEQDAKKGKTTPFIIYNKVHRNSIQTQ